jgi:hypothetical protein
MPTTPDPEPAEEFAGESRVNGSNAFKITIADLIGGRTPGTTNGGLASATLATQTVSLHSSNPGTTGAGELTGGGYARKPVVWGAAAIDGSDRGQITGAAIQFDVPAGAIAFYGVWAGGTYLYGKALNPAVTLSTAGKVTVTPTHAYGLL